MHPPIYQNIEYQLWKFETAEFESKDKPINDSLRIAFGTSASEEPWKRDTPRRNVSDSNVTTPKILKEIRSYLSSDSEAFSHSKFQHNESLFKPHIDPAPQEIPATIKLSPDSFGSYIEAYKESAPKKVSPAPGLAQPYYGNQQYYGGYPSNPYPAQTYVPIYIPVMMQPQIGQMPMAQMPMGQMPMGKMPMGQMLMGQMGQMQSIPQIGQNPMMPMNQGYPRQTTGGDILTGRIKFFDSAQNYGFFVLDCDGSDLFVHYDDFLKSGVTKDYIQMAKAMNTQFTFKKMSYYGKYNLSSKAVDIQIVQGDYPYA